MRKASDLSHHPGADLEKINTMLDMGKLQGSRLSEFFTRPVYYGTSQQTGGDHAESDERCHRR